MITAQKIYEKNIFSFEFQKLSPKITIKKKVLKKRNKTKNVFEIFEKKNDVRIVILPGQKLKNHKQNMCKFFILTKEFLKF